MPYAYESELASLSREIATIIAERGFVLFDIMNGFWASVHHEHWMIEKM